MLGGLGYVMELNDGSGKTGEKSNKMLKSASIILVKPLAYLTYKVRL